MRSSQTSRFHRAGEVSPVINIENTYYILKVEARKNAAVKPITDVRDEIEEPDSAGAHEGPATLARDAAQEGIHQDTILKDVRVGITFGDPAGVGPEIVRASLQSGKLPRSVECTVIGATDAFAPGRPVRASAAHAMARWRRRFHSRKPENFRPWLPDPSPRERCMKPDLRFPVRRSFCRTLRYRLRHVFDWRKDHGGSRYRACSAC